MKRLSKLLVCLLAVLIWGMIIEPKAMAYASTDPVTHTITYNLNGGVISGDYSTTYQEGVGLILPTYSTVKKSGYAFGGWYTDEACIDNPISTISQSSTLDYVLYAKWLNTTLDDKRETPRVILSSDRGFADNDFVVVEYVVNDLLYSEAICDIADEKAAPMAAYTIKYYNQQNNVISSNKVDIKMLLPRTIEEDEVLCVYYVDLGGDVNKMTTTIEGDYVVINEAVVSGTYVLATYEKSNAGIPWWVYTALIVTLVSFAILIVLLTKKKKEYKITSVKDVEVEQYKTETMPTIGEDAELKLQGEEYAFYENVAQQPAALQEKKSASVSTKRATKKATTSANSTAKKKTTTKKSTASKTTKNTSKKTTTKKTDKKDVEK